MSADLTTTYLGFQLGVPADRLVFAADGRAGVVREIAETASPPLCSRRSSRRRWPTGRAGRRRWYAEEHAGGARAYMEHVDRAHLDPYLDP